MRSCSPNPFLGSILIFRLNIFIINLKLVSRIKFEFEVKLKLCLYKLRTRRETSIIKKSNFVIQIYKISDRKININFDYNERRKSWTSIKKVEHKKNYLTNYEERLLCLYQSIIKSKFNNWNIYFPMFFSPNAITLAYRFLIPLIVFSKLSVGILLQAFSTKFFFYLRFEWFAPHLS